MNTVQTRDYPFNDSSDYMKSEPVARKLWELLMQAIHEQQRRVTFGIAHGEENMWVRFESEHFGFLPGYAFKRIESLLLRMGRDLAHNPHSPFSVTDVTFIKYKTKKRVIHWRIDYAAANDGSGQLDILLKRAYRDLKREEHEKIERERNQKRNWWLILGVAWIFGVAWGVFGLWYRQR